MKGCEFAPWLAASWVRGSVGMKFFRSPPANPTLRWGCDRAAHRSPTVKTQIARHLDISFWFAFQCLARFLRPDRAA